jgi:hypothetical protein
MSSMPVVGRAVMIGALVAAALYVPNARADDLVCDWTKALAMLPADKRFGKPITASNKTAEQLSAVANLNVSNQAMIVPVYGATPEQLKFIILTCGPNDTWTPRHFIIDVEAERRFYNLAPPPPVDVSEEQPKPKKRTRRADQ